MSSISFCFFFAAVEGFQQCVDHISIHPHLSSVHGKREKQQKNKKQKFIAGISDHVNCLSSPVGRFRVWAKSDGRQISNSIRNCRIAVQSFQSTYSHIYGIYIYISHQQSFVDNDIVSSATITTHNSIHSELFKIGFVKMKHNQARITTEPIIANVFVSQEVQKCKKTLCVYWYTDKYINTLHYI